MQKNKTKVLFCALVLGILFIVRCASRREFQPHECNYTLHQLRSMDPVLARDILLEMYGDICVEPEIYEKESHPQLIKNQPSPTKKHHDMDKDIENRGIQTDSYTSQETTDDEQSSVTSTEFVNPKSTANQSERQELMKLYEATNGDHWLSRDGWGTSAHMCGWHGITCTASCVAQEIEERLCSVQEIDLSNNGLEGTLPFLTFSSLTIFNVESNQLSGAFPDFDFPHLQVIQFSSNELSGSFPTLDYPLLRYAYGMNNKFTAIPSIISSPSLAYLNAESNSMQGALPTIESPFLVVLDLSNNEFEGPIYWPQSPSAESYKFSSNHLSGTFQLSNLPTISVLDISNNKLTGTAQLEDVGSLFSADLSRNEFSGLQISSSPLLRMLNLESNMLAGPMPNLEAPRIILLDYSNNFLSSSIPSLIRFPYLRYLLLSDNLLEGSLPKIQESPNLINLDLSTNLISGTIETINDHMTLEVLDLSTNQLHGSLPPVNSSKLVELHFDMNKLSGVLPLINLPLVTRMTASSNFITGTLPNFQGIPSLVYLNLAGNQLRGTLPDFCCLPLLQVLRLSENFIDGTIPKFSGDLPNLLELFLDNNLISGTVPDFINVPNLMTLRLYHTSISGTLPEFSRLPLLKELDVSHTKISGTLPAFFGCQVIKIIQVSNTEISEIQDLDLFSLEELYAYNTKITGPLPDFIAPKLLYLDLSLNNNLQGTLPPWKSFTELLSLNLFMSPQVTGPLPAGMDEYVDIFELHARGTKMKADLSGYELKDGGDSILPASLTLSGAYRLENPGDLYQCPVIGVNNTNTIQHKIDIHPEYYDYIYCQCLPNYFGFGDRCVRCPTGCDCSGVNILKGCFVTPTLKDTSDVIACPNPNACDFTIPNERLPILSPEFELECQEGYEGRGCSKCSEGFVLESGSCNECDVAFTITTSLVLLAILLGGFALSITLEWFSVLDFGSAQLDIFLFYTQAVTIISSIIDIPNVDRLIGTISAIFTLKMPSLDCLEGDRLDLLTGINLLRVPFIILVGAIVYVLARKYRPKSRGKVVGLVFIFLEASYYSVTNDVLSVFGCTLQDKGVGKWFLTAYPWVQCSPLTEGYVRLMLATIPGVVFLFGYPVLLWHISGQAWADGRMPANEKSIQVNMPVQSTRTTETSNSRKVTEALDDERIDFQFTKVSEYVVTNLNDVNIEQETKIVPLAERQRSHSSLAKNIPSIWQDIVDIESENLVTIYERRCYWWVAVRIAQSILFGFSVNIVPYTNPEILYVTLFSWVQISILLQNKYRPYLHESDDHMAILSLNVLYFSFFGALMHKIIGTSEWLPWTIFSVNAIFVIYFAIEFFPAVKQKAKFYDDKRVMPRDVYGTRNA